MLLLLIEDDPVIARELQLRWRARGWVVRTCGDLASADAALGAVEAQGYELIVLDLNLPDGDGLAWLHRFREQDRITPTLILTARSRVADRVLGLHGGADDYLVKPFAPEELDARIEVLTRRAQVARGDHLHYGRLTWRRDLGRAYVDDHVLDLSPREFEVLGLLIQRAPRLIAKRALIEALAERNLELGDSASEIYISRLRRKLLGSGTQVRTMRGFGYMLVLDPDGADAAGERV
jgi:DNA-binding response OmpR family regulator